MSNYVYQYISDYDLKDSLIDKELLLDYLNSKWVFFNNNEILLLSIKLSRFLLIS